jgi:hypothetical protein
VLGDECLRVSGERRRVAGNVDEARRLERANMGKRLAGEPGARRVDYDDVGIAGAVSELLDVRPDVAGEERGIRKAVELTVLDGSGDGFL